MEVVGLVEMVMIQMEEQEGLVLKIITQIHFHLEQFIVEVITEQVIQDLQQVEVVAQVLLEM